MAQIISGVDIAREIQQQLQEKVETLQKQYATFMPHLAIIQVGDREEANVGMDKTMKTAEEIGIKASKFRLPSRTSEDELSSVIKRLNEDTSVHGIIVLLPLDTSEKINTDRILNVISPAKDIDGLHGENAAKLSRGELSDCIIPCTPQGCLELIRRTGVSVVGKRAILVGRSKIVGGSMIVGMPMAHLLIWNHATVTVCHSRTVDLPHVVREGDIVVVAIGCAQMVKSEWIKPGAIVIDCGMNSITDETTKSGRRLVGDVDFESVKSVASYITPVPGGVGPMTVIMLLSNTVLCAEKLITQ